MVVTNSQVYGLDLIAFMLEVQESINAYHYLLPEMVVTNSQVYGLDLIAFMLAANQCNIYNMCRNNSYAIVT